MCNPTTEQVFGVYLTSASRWFTLSTCEVFTTTSYAVAVAQANTVGTILSVPTSACVISQGLNG